MKSSLGISMRTNIKPVSYPPPLSPLSLSNSPSSFSICSVSDSLFLYSSHLCAQPPHTGFLVHQRPNLPDLADWASERLQLVVIGGQSAVESSSPLFVSRLSLRLSLACPSYCTFFLTEIHSVINRWKTSVKQGYLTRSPAQIPEREFIRIAPLGFITVHCAQVFPHFLPLLFFHYSCRFENEICRLF